MKTEPEKRVQIAERMYEMRRLARRLHGDKYQERLKTWIEIIQAVMQGHGLREIEVLPFVSREAIADGKPLSDGTILMLTAATVEMLEPSAV